MRGLLAAILVLAASPASAVEAIGFLDDGNFWLRACQREQLGYCHGYLEGIIDANTTLAEPNFCPPKRMGLEQARLVVLKYLREAPEAHHMSFLVLTTVALRSAYPCKKAPATTGSVGRY
jgi:hypothetical protein